jgi:hypothetical protein
LVGAGLSFPAYLMAAPLLHDTSDDASYMSYEEEVIASGFVPFTVPYVFEDEEMKEKEDQRVTTRLCEDVSLAKDIYEVAKRMREAEKVTHVVSSSDEEGGSQPASQGGSQRSCRSNASQTVRPTKRKRGAFVTLYPHHDVFGLSKIEAPKVCGVRADGYARTTDFMGRWLIEKGFPLLKPGSATLCFLISLDVYDEHTGELIRPATVAKVPKYGFHSCDVGDEKTMKKCLYCKYEAERSRDLAMSQEWHGGFAHTELIYVDVINEFGRHSQLYVQELLEGPFTRGGLDSSRLSYNTEDARTQAMVVTNMVHHNRNVRQFAWTRPKKLVFPTAIEGVSIETEERKWLVGFDYE